MIVNRVKKIRHKLGYDSWHEQWRYSWINAFNDVLRPPMATVLTVMVIAISLTLPSICYIMWKNTKQAAEQWYPTPQLTAWLDKTLDNKAAEKIVTLLRAQSGVETVNYLSREEAALEFRNWSGFGSALDMLEENPLPAMVIITPELNFQDSKHLNTLRERFNKVVGITEIRMDDSWFARLEALTNLAGQVAAMIGLLMVIAVFLVIGNSVRLSIFSCRDTINVMKLIGATNGFILRPFLNGGAVLGFAGAILSLLVSGILVWRLESVVAKVATLFGSIFVLNGLSWDECVLLILISAMIGWVAAWLATVQHLRRFTPD